MVHVDANVCSRGNVGIKVNDQLGIYLQTKKGLSQGHPLSPILFNVVVDMLTTMVSRGKEEGQVRGVVPHLVEDGLSILQYTDDTTIFLDHDIERAKNMKLLLCVYEQLPGLKINFHQSDLFCYGEAKQNEDVHVSIFGCNILPPSLNR